ncbi:MAG TPA: STAS domain-containing protein, partial [Thermoleophilia bacterium]|nr:STAS domain-containing protein [Thermoleophilia bacterium]
MTDIADFRVEFLGPGGEIAVVVAAGELDLHSSPPFKEALVGAIEGAASRVVVDLTDVTFIDSSALGALIGGARRSALSGTELMIVCPPGSVARVIDLTGLHRAFAIYPNREEALGATAGAPADSAGETIGAAD